MTDRSPGYVPDLFTQMELRDRIDSARREAAHALCLDPHAIPEKVHAATVDAHYALTTALHALDRHIERTRR